MSDNLKALHVKTDAFFNQIQSSYGNHMECGKGCSSCCHQNLTLFPVEIAPILSAVNALSAEHKRRLKDRLQEGDRTDECPLLENNCCIVYASRPTICRSHGLPIRYTDDHGHAQRDTCPLNFAGVLSISALPESSLLDIDKLNEMLAITNMLAIRENEELKDSSDRQNVRDALIGYLTDGTF